MFKILEFFRDTKKFSSKRLAFVSTVPFVIYGTLSVCNQLIQTHQGQFVVDIWLGFFTYSAVLGGFVAIEPMKNVITNFLTIKNKKNDN
jgi:hypothetical protein